METQDNLARAAIHTSDLGRALGVSHFPSDIYREHYLTGVAVRSPYPHCRVKQLDVSAARQMPGVQTIITASDIPGRKVIGKMVDDTPVLVEDIVRSVLDPLCLIAAETEAQALEAAKAVIMDLEPLPALFSTQEAMHPEAPKIHPDGNVVHYFKLRHGEIEKGFSEADIILEDIYHIPSIEHAFLETEAAFAEPIENGIRIYVGSQNPYLERDLAAAVLNLPQDQIEVIDVHAGGGFGGKDDSLITQYVALLAWASRQPVRMTFDRRESMRGHSKRHAMTIKAKTGATRKGHLTAMQMEIVADTGSYAHWGPVLMTFASLGASGIYEIPHVFVDTYVVYTNNIMAGAMRSWGNQAIAFVVESQIDQLAHELELHPLRLRWLNALREESIMPSGQPPPPNVGARRMIEVAANYLGIDLDDPAPVERSGIGFASALQGVNYHFGYEDASEVEVRVGDDGIFEIYAATSDIGQGLEAMLRLVFCRAMGDLSPELVRWMPASTTTSPNAGSTGASRHTSLTGNAVWGAARDLRQQIINLTAEILGTQPEEIEMRGGQLWDAHHELHLSEVLEEALNRGLDLRAKHRFIAPPTTSLDENGQGYPVNQYCYATQIAKVEVDEDTGEVQVLRVDAFIDAGRIINPLGAKKQSEGGVVMGLGYALTEEFLMKEGKPVNEGFTNYLIPTIYDAPPVISTQFVGEPIPFGELGTRGLAEITMVPTAPAIVNAIFNATGARLRRIPATPERILEVLESSRMQDGNRLDEEFLG